MLHVLQLQQDQGVAASVAEREGFSGPRRTINNISKLGESPDDRLYHLHVLLSTEQTSYSVLVYFLVGPNLCICLELEEIENWVR